MSIFDEKTCAELAKHDSDDARAIVEVEKAEISLYKKHQNYYSYGFYIAKKI